MYIKLIRNKTQGKAITGRLVIDGRWFCNTLERKGYEILALCYPVRVTQSPRFKRLLAYRAERPTAQWHPLPSWHQTPALYWLHSHSR